MFKGADKPILGKCINAGHFHGMDGLGDVPDPDAPGLDLIQKEGAVSAMIRLVNENPGQVCVYISVGSVHRRHGCVCKGGCVYVVMVLWLDGCVYMCV